MTKQKVKVEKDRPYYSPALGCYVVDYSVDGEKSHKVFPDYKTGIEWLKTTFPEWFAKKYSLTTWNT
jgi:hypothetical protein